MNYLFRKFAVIIVVMIVFVAVGCDFNGESEKNNTIIGAKTGNISGSAADNLLDNTGLNVASNSGNGNNAENLKQFFENRDKDLKTSESDSTAVIKKSGDISDDISDIGSSKPIDTATLLQLYGDMNLYFGNLHAHSRFSDGEGHPSDGYRYARDVAGLDFYAVTDHAEQIYPWEWYELKKAADAFNQKGKFVAIRGFEYSHSFSGHICVWNSKAYTNSILTPLLAGFYSWVNMFDAVAQFNHPGREFMVFNKFRYVEKAVDNFVAVEVGNKEDGIIQGEYLSWYMQALDNGWKVAPTSNQDNHSLKINSHRTVIISNELSRDALLNALKSRRVYAADDPDIRIIFKVENRWMGSTVFVPKSRKKLKFTVYVSDNEPIKKIQIITSNQTILATKNIIGDLKEVLWEIKIQHQQDPYFFVKVVSYDTNNDEPGYDTQAAVTAPVWIKYY